MNQLLAPCQLKANLAPLTTLELGGPASVLAAVTNTAEMVEVLTWAQTENKHVAVLGAGSNTVVADSGFDGVVLQIVSRGIEVEDQGNEVAVIAAAGEPWDELVALTIAEGLEGLQCLSGIPGTVGATPIQNVGAYGSEVADVIDKLWVLDRANLRESVLLPNECGFRYRWSRFRDEPGRFIITRVAFHLRRGAGSPLRYRELAELFSTTTPPPSEVREAVLCLRRGKSMVIDPDDPNRRSVGSFFVNPVVDEDQWLEVKARAVAAGIVSQGKSPPSHPADGGRKLPAAWLVEQSGFEKGHRRGQVGISSHHALCLIHHGGGRTVELLELARVIQAGVESTFGLRLRAEPVFLGFRQPPLQ